MSRPALQLIGITKQFGATRALRGVSLEVSPGTVHALIGENGAGKSTLMRILSGAIGADTGEIRLGGESFVPADPHDARRRGVAMIYQELNLALHLSAAGNIMLGAEPRRWGFVDHAALHRQARAALEQLGHGDLPLDRPAGTFKVAEQQIIEIARALVTQPQVLIMDEPTSSLTQADVERLFTAIGRLKARGVSVIYISHFLEECRRIADTFTVLKDGEAVHSGRMADITNDELVRRMTGRDVGDLYVRHRVEPGPVVLHVAGLETGPRVADVNFSVHAGEILGLAGLIGAGRTECLRGVFGLDPVSGGEVRVAAQSGFATPARRWAQGVGFLSEDRKEEGLLLARSLADNVTATKLGRFGRFGFISGSRQERATRHWIEELAIRCEGPGQAAAHLSGGNQQKVALARLLEHPARIFLLDEPTRGIDVGSKAQIYRRIDRLAAEGAAVILVSSYLPELLGLCDRIGVMCRGRLVALRSREEWTEASLLQAAIGDLSCP